MSDARLAQFQQQRPRLFHIAYRLLGTRADAEDALQEAWLRWQRMSVEAEDANALAATIVTRLCLDQLRSAEHRRKEYIGPWLPEPLISPPFTDSISYALQVLLETLSAEERCVLLLRDVFGYDHEEIAAVLGSNAAACRKHLERARQRLAAGRSRELPVSKPEHRALLERFSAACATGEVEPLLALLAPNARLRSDGGGRVSAALNPIEGADRIARFLVGVLQKFPSAGRYSFEDWNGEPALVSRLNGSAISVTLIDTDEEGKLAEIFVVMNPAKLSDGVGE